MDDIVEEYVKRVIYEEVRNRNPRDENYAVEKGINKVNSMINSLTISVEDEYLYHQYRLGKNILQILSIRDFYRRLNLENYRELFEIIKIETQSEKSEEKILGGLDSQPKYRLLREQIPNFREKILKSALKYILHMEFKKWLQEFGFKLPECKTDLTEKELYNFILNTSQNNNKNVETETQHSFKDEVKEVFKDFLEKKVIDDDNFNNLVLLLGLYFNSIEYPNNFKKIKVKGRVQTEFARRLGVIYRTTLPNDTMKFDYLALIKSHIDIFKDEDLLKKSVFTELKLYKTLNPKKK